MAINNINNTNIPNVNTTTNNTQSTINNQGSLAGIRAQRLDSNIQASPFAQGGSFSPFSSGSTGITGQNGMNGMGGMNMMNNSLQLLQSQRAARAGALNNSLAASPLSQLAGRVQFAASQLIQGIQQAQLTGIGVNNLNSLFSQFQLALQQFSLFALRQQAAGQPLDPNAIAGVASAVQQLQGFLASIGSQLGGIFGQGGGQMGGGQMGGQTGGSQGGIFGQVGGLNNFQSFLTQVLQFLQSNSGGSGFNRAPVVSDPTQGVNPNTVGNNLFGQLGGFGQFGNAIGTVGGIGGFGQGQIGGIGGFGQGSLGSVLFGGILPSNLQPNNVQGLLNKLVSSASLFGISGANLALLQLLSSQMQTNRMPANVQQQVLSFFRNQNPSATSTSFNIDALLANPIVSNFLAKLNL
ncbi:MAG: hypothetical protein AB1489_28680 [Acidobacteriota bacterium]